jgi:hypothetical protein
MYVQQDQCVAREHSTTNLSTCWSCTARQSLCIYWSAVHAALEGGRGPHATHASCAFGAVCVAQCAALQAYRKGMLQRDVRCLPSILGVPRILLSNCAPAEGVSWVQRQWPNGKQYVLEVTNVLACCFLGVMFAAERRSNAICTRDLHHLHIAASVCGLKRHQQQVSTAALCCCIQLRSVVVCLARADTHVLMVYWKANSKARQHAALRCLQRTRGALGRGRCHVACSALPGRCRADHAVARSRLGLNLGSGQHGLVMTTILPSCLFSSFT